MNSFLRNNITIFKAVVFSVLLKIFIEGISSWKYIKGIYEVEYIYYYYGTFINSVVHLVVIVLFFHYLKIKDVFRKANIKFYIISVLLGILYVFSQKWLNYLYDFVAGTNYSELTYFDFSNQKYKVNLNLFGVVFLAPIFEELFFRSYIQKKLEEFYNKPIISITISTLLFSLLHLPNIHLTFLVLFGGLISSLLFYKSKSVLPSILFHIIWNLMVIIS